MLVGRSRGMMRIINWSSALIGAASATAAAILMAIKPHDPTFELISISLTSFSFNLPFLDADLILTVHVINPNVVSVQYGPSVMSIFYDGSLLGSAHLQAGFQPAKCCRVIRLLARLSGMELACHITRFLADVTKREMVLDAAIDIQGSARVFIWSHRFKVHIDSHVIVDPRILDVIDQDNKSEIKLI